MGEMSLDERTAQTGFMGRQSEHHVYFGQAYPVYLLT
jgi:hypothetical protein